MRKILLYTIPPFVVGIYRKVMRFSKKYYSLNGLDKKLEKYLPEKNGFFVELGANDGVKQSNTLYFERFKGWRGVLVEPVLHNYFLCKLNRSKKNFIYCNACVSFEYKDRFVPIAYANLMTTPLIDRSDIADKHFHLKEGEKFLNKHEETVIFGSLAKTLNAILVESNAPKCIDLLSLDVEGAELEVVLGIDFSDFHFRYICVESRSINVISEYLYKYGYHLIEQLSGHDYLFHNMHHFDQFDTFQAS